MLHFRLESTPYICGNLGSGSVHEMSQWVEYLNMDGKSPMADLRRKNGRKEPWNVKWWGVGNENWGCGGNMRPEFYADNYRRYACYCRNYGAARLYKIACGANGEDYNWTEVLMREVARHMDGLSLHYYTSDYPAGKWHEKGKALDFDEKQWFSMLNKACQMEKIVTRHSTIMDKFDPEKRIGLIVDEWGTWHKVEQGTNPGFLYQQNSMRDALVAGIHLNIFNSHADRVRMANIAQTVNVLQAMILTDGPRMLLTPSYHVFEMYKDHHDADSLHLRSQLDDYEMDGRSLPVLSASASRTRDGEICMTICNLNHESKAEIECEIRGAAISRAKARILASDSLNAHNSFNAPSRVVPRPFEEFRSKRGIIASEIPPASVMVMSIS